MTANTDTTDTSGKISSEYFKEPGMTTTTAPNYAIDDAPTDQVGESGATESRRLEIEAYVQRHTYDPSQVGYDKYVEQCARQMKLPDLLEDDDDIEKASKEDSVRVRGYIPMDLAKEWEARHYSARGASTLLQEAMRAELDRTPLPQVCEGCGGTSEFNGGYWADADIGCSSEICYEVYTCTTCRKSQREGIQVSRAGGVFQPSALEKHELWRYDNGIVWMEKTRANPHHMILH
jgi:hypothetical protein